MRQLLYILFCISITVANLTAQNCIFLDPGSNSFPIMCFSDPARMDGDVIELTTEQFNSDAFMMSLITTNINGGGLTTDCDGTASVQIIRIRRLVSNSSSTARNTANLSVITFETSSITSAGDCDGGSLSLQVRIVAPVPTLSQWSLLIFGLLLLNLGVIFVRQKNTITKSI